MIGNAERNTEHNPGRILVGYASRNKRENQEAQERWVGSGYPLQDTRRRMEARQEEGSALFEERPFAGVTIVSGFS
jgi:hypothetical protein